MRSKGLNPDGSNAPPKDEQFNKRNPFFAEYGVFGASLTHDVLSAIKRKHNRLADTPIEIGYSQVEALAQASEEAVAEFKEQNQENRDNLKKIVAVILADEQKSSKKKIGKKKASPKKAQSMKGTLAKDSTAKVTVLLYSFPLLSLAFGSCSFGVFHCRSVLLCPEQEALQDDYTRGLSRCQGQWDKNSRVIYLLGRGKSNC